MVFIPTDCWSRELAWDYVHVSAARELTKAYVHNFSRHREHPCDEDSLWVCTCLYILFKRKTHLQARDQENTSVEVSPARTKVPNLLPCSRVWGGWGRICCTLSGCSTAVQKEFCKCLNTGERKCHSGRLCIFLVQMAHRRHVRVTGGRVSHVLVKSLPARLPALCLHVMNFKRLGFHLGVG